MEAQQQVAYNAGRDMCVKGWAKACPYASKSVLTRFWWRGWFDAERKKATTSSG
jgi:hypothetical protein